MKTWASPRAGEIKVFLMEEYYCLGEDSSFVKGENDI